MAKTVAGKISEKIGSNFFNFECVLYEIKGTRSKTFY